MAINISVQYSGGILPDFILLTHGYYHWAMWVLCLYSLCNSILLLLIQSAYMFLLGNNLRTDLQNRTKKAER